MKKLIFLVLAFWGSSSLRAQEGYHDSTALMILDKVGGYFGEVNSLKFTSRTSQDVAFSDDFFIKEFKTSEVVFQGADRFAAKVLKQGREEFYYYDGTQMAYYSLDGNFYTIADAPATTLETLDWLYDEFGIDVVLADFLYPDFTSDMIMSMDYLEYLGVAELGGESLFHIGGANADMTFQLWVTHDLALKPRKIVITYFGKPYSRQLDVEFESWEINQLYPNSIFEFLPPPNSKQITWTKKN